MADPNTLRPRQPEQSPGQEPNFNYITMHDAMNQWNLRDGQHANLNPHSASLKSPAKVADTLGFAEPVLGETTVMAENGQTQTYWLLNLDHRPGDQNGRHVDVRAADGNAVNVTFDADIVLVDPEQWKGGNRAYVGVTLGNTIIDGRSEKFRQDFQPIAGKPVANFTINWDGKRLAVTNGSLGNRLHVVQSGGYEPAYYPAASGTQDSAAESRHIEAPVPERIEERDSARGSETAATATEVVPNLARLAVGAITERSQEAAVPLDPAVVFSSVTSFNEALNESPFQSEMRQIQDTWLSIRNAEHGNQLWDSNHIGGALQEMAPALPEVTARSGSLADMVKGVGERLWDDLSSALHHGDVTSARQILHAVSERLSAVSSEINGLNENGMGSVSERLAMVSGLQEAKRLASGPEAYRLSDVDERALVEECRSLYERGNDVHAILASLRGRLADSQSTWKMRSGVVDTMHEVANSANSSALQATYNELAREYQALTASGRMNADEFRALAEHSVAHLLNQARSIHAFAEQAATLLAAEVEHN